MRKEAVMYTTKITDVLSGKNVLEHYHQLKETQWYSEHQMKSFQLKKLKSLLIHCFDNVPFYRNIMEQQNIRPKNAVSLDILEQFPVIDKEVVKDNYNEFIPENIKSIKGSKIGQTGGTTGGILYTRNCANTRSSTWAAYKRFEDWMGVQSRDKSLILMGGHVIGNPWKDKVKNYIYNLLRNRIVFSPYDTTQENIANIIKALEGNQFELIRSYSQFLFSLAKRLETEKRSFHVKAITTTAEPLTQEHRVLFEKVFNSQIFDQYGCGEIGGIAFECDHHKGLHITEEKVIVEVNKKNELIVTDLDNYSLPFIRYWNADQAIISDDLCTCGRKSKLIKQIMGRTCDHIIGANGEFLHWAFFWHLFFDSAVAEKRNLRKFQVVQLTNNKLTIRMVAEPLSDDEKHLLVSSIQSRVGALSIDFSFEDEIENATSGKYRPVINHLL